MDFRDYALDAATKFRPEKSEEGFRNRKKMLNKAFQPVMPLIRNARAILDFGCGSGDLLMFLQSVTPGSLVGYDPSPTQLDIARIRSSGNPRIRYVSDLDAMRATFDLVFSIHVVEHISDDNLDEFAAALTRCLASSGKIILATPNGLNPLAYAFFMSTDRTHVRMHSAFSLNEVFRPLGFEVKQVERELPQAYDFLTFCKTGVWWCLSQILKVAVYATAGGVRSLRYPLMMASSLYFVIGPISSREQAKSGPLNTP